MKKRGKRIKMIALLLIIAIAFAMFVYYQDYVLQVTNIKIATDKISAPVRIVQLSDLHGAEFGKDNERLIELVKTQKPDIICFTGDLIDKRRKQIDGGINLLIELKKIAPIYYIPGNHEFYSGLSDVIYSRLNDAGINVMQCDIAEFDKDGAKIQILGLSEAEVTKAEITDKISEFEKLDGYKILLSHYPENFKKYQKDNIDLMLAGHAHGGQIILPFIGGLYAPGQGFFPKYYRGLYEENGVKMVVSRGLGNSLFPLRIFNRPEVVVIDLSPT